MDLMGHNKPPLAVEVRERHKDVFDAMDDLASALELVPPQITNDDDEGKAQDVVLKCKKVISTAKAMHKIEKDPFNEKIKELKNLFEIPIEKVEKVAKTVLERLDVYKEKKAADERRRREDEARKAAEEAAKKQAEAEEADRKRREAEEARRQEEEKARKAQEERERAEKEAKEARERAEALKAEQARLEAERKEREAEEAAAKAEHDKVLEEQRRKEREDHDKRMAELKAQREAEEAKAKAAREEAAKALQERREAEDAAAAAKREEKAAAREVNNNLEDAVKLERRSAKLEGAANASEAELSRGRGDYGSVGSRATFWTWRMLDRDKVPLEALRAYIHPDAIDAAVTRFMNSHRPELGQGRDVNDLLPGVEFYRDTNTRVA